MVVFCVSGRVRRKVEELVSYGLGVSGSFTTLQGCLREYVVFVDACRCI